MPRFSSVEAPGTRQSTKRRDGASSPLHFFRALLEEYRQSLEASNRSPKTISWYLEILERFFSFLDSSGLLKPIGELGSRELRAYIANLQQARRWASCSRISKEKGKLSPFTVCGHARAVKALWGWLLREGYIAVNPLSKFPLPFVPDKPVPALRLETINRLLNHIDRSKPVGLKYYCILLTLLDTGLRISELAAITMEDIDLDRGCIVVLGKGRRIRPVFVQADTKRELLRYIGTTRPLLCRVESPYLFPRTDGGPITASSVQQYLRRLAAAADLGAVRSSPHVFRHSFATHAVANGANVFALRDLMGHRSLQTTMKYIHLTPEDLQKQHSQFSPVAKLDLPTLQKKCSPKKRHPP